MHDFIMGERPRFCFLKQIFTLRIYGKKFMWCEIDNSNLFNFLKIFEIILTKYLRSKSKAIEKIRRNSQLQ